MEDGRHLFDLTGHQNPILSSTSADKGSLLLTGARDASLQIWDLLSPPISMDTQHKGNTNSVSISPCSTYAVSGGEDSKLKIYDLEKTQVVCVMETNTEEVTQVSVLRDSERILVAYKNGSIQLWNGLSQEHLQTFEGSLGSAVNCIAVSADSQLLMSGSDDTQVTFWSIKNGTRCKTFHNHSSPVVGVAFCQDYMFSASKDGQVCVREYSSAKIVSTTSTHTGELVSLAVCPNAASFATGSKDKTCHIVNTKTGKLMHILIGHRGTVTCVKFFPDCSQILTGSEDGFIRVWSAESGEYMSSHSLDVGVLCCDISLRGNVIFCGTAGGWVTSLACSNPEKSRAMLLDKNSRKLSSSLSASSSGGGDSESKGEQTVKKTSLSDANI